MKPDELIFVYNAEKGFFNALMDSAHKVLSPSTYECSLCQLTYGLTSMLSLWKKFLESLDVQKTFLHRREFRERHPELKDVALPVILQSSGGKLEVLASAAEIKSAGTLDALVHLMRARIGDVARTA